MHIYLPYPSFSKTAACFPTNFLVTQVYDAHKALLTLGGFDTAQMYHPMIRMWAGWELALSVYHDAMITEYLSRGGSSEFALLNIKKYTLPPWLGNERIHKSHQSNLIRKHPQHFRPIFGFDIPINLTYVWPLP